MARTRKHTRAREQHKHLKEANRAYRKHGDYDQYSRDLNDIPTAPHDISVRYGNKRRYEAEMKVKLRRAAKRNDRTRELRDALDVG